MQTLKTIVVIGVLAIVGYGLYIGLNNGFEFANQPIETPDWIRAATTDEPAPPNIQLVPQSDGESTTGPMVQLGTPQPDGMGAVGLSDTSSIPRARYPDAETTPKTSPGTTHTHTSQDPSADGSNAHNASPPATTGTAAGTDLATNLQTSLTAKGAGTGASTAGNTATDMSDATFAATLASARGQLQRGQLGSALHQLSIWYEDPRIAAKDHQELTQLLDQVAGTVIYSRQHHLEPAYRVTAGQSLDDIAKHFSIPPGLLAKINGITTSTALTPGQELKVVRGPFSAVINTRKGVLTLWVGGRYAGRFVVTTGPEFQQIVGPFIVREKNRAHPSHGGQPWIEIGPIYQAAGSSAGTGPQMGIAGMANPTLASRGDVPGRIGASTKDAGDLFDILSSGSKITIRQ